SVFGAGVTRFGPFDWMLGGRPDAGRHPEAVRRELGPDARGERDRRVDSVAQVDRDDAFGGEPRKDGIGQVRPNLVEAEPAGLLIGVLSLGAEGREMVVPIDDGNVVYRGAPAFIGGAEQ